MSDRLQEIKARWADGTLGYSDYAALGAAATGKADVDWLVGEVETWRKAWEVMAPELKASIRQRLGIAHLDRHGRPSRLA